MTDITSANAVLIINAPNVFPSGQQIQGFAADDVFDTDAIRTGETLMGVDGFLSAGFVYEQLKQTIMLQADSPSRPIFDQIYQFELASVSKQVLSATFKFKSMGIQFNIAKGFMTNYTPMSSARRVMQPARYMFEWELAVPVPLVGG